MEKPDFLKLEDEKFGSMADNATWSDGCEYVWSTHVMPLIDWKESALSLFKEWERVSEYIKPRCRLGDRYSERALELFKMIDADNKLLRERVSSLENICEMDRKTEYQYNQLYKEKEALRDEIERLKADNARLRNNQFGAVDETTNQVI